MAKETATQTLALLLEHLGLPKGSTSEDISLAIAQREEAAKATAKTRVARPKWAPTVHVDGAIVFSGTRVSLAADEVDTLKGILDSQDFADFLATHADEIRDRAGVIEHRKQRRAAAKAAKEEEGAEEVA